MTTIMQLARGGDAGKRDAMAMLEKQKFYSMAQASRKQMLRESLDFY